MSLISIAANIPDSLLTKEQQSYLEKQQMDNTVLKASQWVGLGKEIGSAFNEGLSALTDHADKFSRTRVGTFAMVLIAYKVMGRDFIHYIFGILFFIIISILLYFATRKHHIPYRIRTKGNWIDVIKGTAEYKVIELHSDEKETGFWTLIIGMAINITITLFTIFS